ncbi:hypothetical protein K438DRAFT_1795743 [Mycena galopus ATCC 62051]|nr:hypothetical protein K438DRAFT_1795743 [Mycena galopus ATCC 62051]
MLSTLAADRAHVADLSAEILLLEQSLSALRIQKEQAQKRLDAYTYPVLTLPNEIISEIFINFLPIYPRYPSFAGLDSPTLLTQICRQWRQIAVATLELWRVISFPDDSDSATFAQHLDLCRIWLTRSCSFPLAIRLDSHTLRASHISQVLETITPHRARLERLDLNLSPSHISVLEGGPLPLLRHLDLTLLDDTVVTLSQAPLLRSITLSALIPLEVTLPWAQLTALTLNFVHRREYVAILRQTTSLVHCELGIVLHGDDDPAPKHGIDLPCLESLALFMHTSNPPAEQPPLDDFITPALRSLRFVESCIGPQPIDRLSAFISRSDCKLDEVGVIVRRLASEDSYSAAFPSIRRFFFEEDFDFARVSYFEHV